MEEEYNDIHLLEENLIKYGKINSFQDLLVWQKSMSLVKEIYIATKQMPDEEKFGLISQIRRAAVSIPSNIAEGWGRKSTGSYINHLKIANGSWCETQTQLLIIEQLNYIESAKVESIRSLLNESGRLLRSLIEKLEQKTSN